jgi:hypothetical protein
MRARPVRHFGSSVQDETHSRTSMCCEFETTIFSEQVKLYENEENLEVS